MSSPNIQIVTAVYQAFARQDVAALLELLDVDFEIEQTELLPWGGRYHGHAGAQEFLGQLANHITSRPEPAAFFEAGERVVVTGRTRGTANGNGRVFDVPMVHLWTLRDGKALRFEVYIDTPEMLRVLAA